MLDLAKHNFVLYNADCLEQMKKLEDKSIDLIFCDLPYGQTSCKWDCKIDLKLFWKEVMRIKKLNTPIFFTTTTKFGVELITSAPKKCFFRYDIVWMKSAPAGFLCAKKMPLRKHEMIYVFYEKLPFYDLSSHTHKFIKKPDPKIIKDTKQGTNTYDTEKRKKPILRLSDQAQYEPPLPVSVVSGASLAVKEDLYGQTCDMKNNYEESQGMNKKERKEVRYDPPLPVSVVKEECTVVKRTDEGCDGLYGKETGKVFIYDEKGKLRNSEPRYDPPLPVSVVKEEKEKYVPPQAREIPQNQYNNNEEQVYNPDYLEKKVDYKGRNGGSMYEPPLPDSVVKEPEHKWVKGTTDTYGGAPTEDSKECGGHQRRYEPPLPVSILKEKEKYPGKPVERKNTTYGDIISYEIKERKNGESRYDPPLPDSMLEIKSTRGKHSTEKPVALMEWVLKYYSKEGDVILDPTCGSGSTGVACKNMNRKFIGIEMDEEIFKIAEDRLSK